MANVDKYSILFNAAKTGDEDKIKSVLDTNEVHIQTTFNGETALHVAISNDQDNVVKFLVGKSNELLSMKDRTGRTPLHIAVYKGNLGMVEFICNSCSRRVINDKDKGMKCPLFIAVSQNHPEIVKSLLNHGATFMNEPDHYDSIVIFHMAIRKNYKSIVQILLPRARVVDVCACPDYPDPEFAEEIFNHLLETQVATAGSFNRIDHQLAFSFASFHNREYQVKRLVETGANVNTRDDLFKMTALEHSIVNKNVSMVEYLISKRADVNAGYLYDHVHIKRPLHYASLQLYTPRVKQKEFEDSCQIMEILLKNGASVNVFNHEYKTPLHCAVEENEFRPEKIRLLLHYGADVNAHLNEERTPIFFAKCEAILQMLIDYGANVNHKSLVEINSQLKIMTPLYFAILRGDLPKVHLLLENGAEIFESPPDISMIDYLIHNIPEFNETTIDGLKDITLVIKRLCGDCSDDKNVIPILAKRYFQGEVIINSKEFVSPSGLFFSKFKECQKELARMLDFDINHNLKLSLFNILAMPIAKLTRYMKNQEVLNFFVCQTIEDKFPMYSGMIMRRFNKAKEDRQLIDSSSVALQNIIFRSYKIHLTDPLADKIIVHFLHTVDRKKLLEL